MTDPELIIEEQESEIAHLRTENKALSQKHAYFEHMAGEDKAQIEALRKERDKWMEYTCRDREHLAIEMEALRIDILKCGR
jgi:hypothetical protein